MMDKDYWIECVSSSLDEHGIVATVEQIEAIADDISTGQDNYNLVTGIEQATLNSHDAKDNEIAELKRLLKLEEDKIGCPECSGRGAFYDKVLDRFLEKCSKCNGEGKIFPELS